MVPAAYKKCQAYLIYQTQRHRPVSKTFYVEYIKSLLFISSQKFKILDLMEPNKSIQFISVVVVMSCKNIITEYFHLWSQEDTLYTWHTMYGLSKINNITFFCYKSKYLLVLTTLSVFGVGVGSLLTSFNLLFNASLPMLSKNFDKIKQKFRCDLCQA